MDWHTYNCLSEAIGEGEHVHLAYDGKDLEIVVTSNVHENLKELVNKIVNAVTSGLDIDYVSCGETTWKTKIRGLEADLSYYFDPESVARQRAWQVRIPRITPARFVFDVALTCVVSTQLWHHIYCGGGLCDLPTWQPPARRHALGPAARTGV